MGSWADHGANTGGFYKCNKYDPKKAKGDAKANSAKMDLDRYLHYYQRFFNHGQSKKFAQKQQENTLARMAQLQNSSQGLTWIDVQFLKTAMEQVFELRQVLSFTYVFAYYLSDGPEKTLFEYLQEQLEISTEKLSELSEKPLEEIDRVQVVNYTRVTAQFMQNLLDGVTNGLTSSVPSPYKRRRQGEL
jgi:ariadne-1